MCGLVGQIYSKANGFGLLDIEQFGQAMFINQMRGKDSTGIVGIGNDADYWWLKQTGGWDDLRMLDSKSYREWEAPVISKGKIIFGHGRLATRGDITIANAHPFVQDKPGNSKKAKKQIILVHNGTLDTYQPHIKGSNAFPVDSEWLTFLIATEGPHAAFSKVVGAIACMWYDSEEKTFNVYRNDQRPLFGYKTKSSDWYFNSEIASLHWLRHKHHLQVEDLVPLVFEAGHMYTWKLENTDGFVKVNIPYPKSIYDYSSHLGPVGAPYHSRQRGILELSDDDDSELTSHGFNWQNRSLTTDRHGILSGAIVSVKWDDKGRHTQYKTGGIVNDRVAPYEQFLTQLSEGGDETLRTVKQQYQMNNSRWFNEYVRINGQFQSVHGINTIEKPIDADVIPISKFVSDKLNNKCIDVKYKSGSQIKFTSPVTKGNSTVISHKAICHPNNPYHFNSYENNLDGRIKVGDRLKMEVVHIGYEGAQQRLIRAIGVRLAEKMDVVVDCSFLTTKWTEKEIGKLGYFEGTVSFIQVASKEQHDITKSYIDVRLTDVIALGIQTEIENDLQQTTH